MSLKLNVVAIQRNEGMQIFNFPHESRFGRGEDVPQRGISRVVLGLKLLLEL